MKILNIIFEDRLGGATKRIIHVASWLHKHGIHTTIVFPDRGGDAADKAEAMELDIIRFNIRKIPRLSHVFSLFVWIAYIPKEVYAFVKLMKIEQPDLVHLNGAFFFTPAIAAKISRIPLAWHLNDIRIPKNLAKLFGVMVQLLASKVVTSSCAVARYYGIKKYVIIYPPLTIQQRSYINRSVNQRPVVGLLGNWVPSKGLEHFIHACALARCKPGCAFDITIAGSVLETQHRYYEKIQTLIKQYNLCPFVTEMGFVSEPSSFLGNLDLLVVSSVSEAFSMAALEAISLGIPVVAFDVGGVGEVLGHGKDKAGILVPLRNDLAMAEAICEVLNNQALTDTLRFHGMKRAVLLFSMQRCIERHVRIYNNIIQSE